MVLPHCKKWEKFLWATDVMKNTDTDAKQHNMASMHVIGLKQLWG